MTLSAAPPLRRGSTPLPIKHQLRREEAVSDDCDWALGVDSPPPPPITFSVSQDDSGARPADGSQARPLRIVLLGQNGVGKSTLAMAMAGDFNRSTSVDSDSLVIGEGYVRTVTVDDEESCVLIIDNWKQDLSTLKCEVFLLVFSVTDRRSFHRAAQLRLILRETQPQTPIILVGNKSDLVRSREVSTEEASAMIFEGQYLELSASLDHRTSELLEGAVRAARGQWPGLGAVDGSPGGSRRESLTSKAKRFLSSLVPRYPRERDRERDRGGRVSRQKSRSCHDISAL